MLLHVGAIFVRAVCAVMGCALAVVVSRGDATIGVHPLGDASPRAKDVFSAPQLDVLKKMFKRSSAASLGAVSCQACTKYGARPSSSRDLGDDQTCVSATDRRSGEDVCKTSFGARCYMMVRVTRTDSEVGNGSGCN